VTGGALLVLLLLPRGAPAEPRLSLDQAEARRPGDFGPQYDGTTVTVKGVVSLRAIAFPGYSLLPIQDNGYGLMLEASDNRLDGFRPGDEVEASGVLGQHSGLVVLHAGHVQLWEHSNAPRPVSVDPAVLQGFRYLGMLVSTSGRVLEMDGSAGGPYILIGDARSPYKIFVPYPPSRANLSFAGVAVGDTVRVTGIASEYCPGPPYNRSFELLAPNIAALAVVGRQISFPVAVPLAVLGMAALMLLIWWRRDRRLRAQREMLRRTHELGEEILGSSSTDQILKKVRLDLPRIFGVSTAELYLYNRHAKTLEALERSGAEPVTIPLASPPAGPQAGAVACFHYRTVLAIPDTSRSPFPVAAAEAPGAARSLLFVPMLAHGEIVGILELDRLDRARDFSRDEQALALHLGNQIAVAVKLLDQRTVREQLFRTEKLAAVGQLISGIVNELETPLASIANLAQAACSELRDPVVADEVAHIAAEARRASEIVSRLIGFAGLGQAQSQLVDLNGLLNNLIAFREREWKVRGIRVHSLLAGEPVTVMGSRGQLEQVFLNLLVHAEQALSDASDKLITVRTSRIASRVLAEVSYKAPPGSLESRSPEEGAFLGVCRSIITGHAGEIREVQIPGADAAFQVELPWMPPEKLAPAPAANGYEPSHTLTALVIEPAAAAQAQLRALLAARGYRVVPVSSSDEALDLAQRLRFDAVFCSMRAPGLNWVETAEQLETRASGFVLLGDIRNPELAESVTGPGRFLLAKPIDEDELDRVLDAIWTARLHRMTPAR
jgi:signal transduction histidine kinase/CheY-like chemotaxis protein